MTLPDPSVRLHEIEIAIFVPFRPMLSQRCDVVQFHKVLSGNVKMYVETKFDGERFQLHMENGQFKYFSKNGYDYTSTYGNDFSNGLYTPLLKNAFRKDVRKIILDGEMMGWNKSTKKFGSKGWYYWKIIQYPMNFINIKKCCEQNCIVRFLFYKNFQGQKI